MALTESTMMTLGKVAPRFTLPDTVTNYSISLLDAKGGKGTVVYFTCNHCPYVIHVNSAIISLANEFTAKGINFIAISSNDVKNYPEDAPDKMSIVAKVLQFPFPYLYDESQAVARAYDAACTPDFYLFDNEMKLYYRGRIDGSRPGNDTPLTGTDLRDAMTGMLDNQPAPEKQYPSAGCNIKWKG